MAAPASERSGYEELASRRNQLDRASRSAQIADIVRGSILDGSFRPGTRLSEPDICAALGVSRNTLREAFRSLVDQRLATHELNRGVFVRVPSRADVAELYTCRRIIEGAGVQDVCGGDFVEHIVMTMPDGKVREIPVKGVFVKLRRPPNSALVQEWVDCDNRGHIIVDAYCATSWAGAFAAGDVTLVSEQSLVHIGEGAKAAISAYHYLLMRGNDG